MIRSGREYIRACRRRIRHVVVGLFGIVYLPGCDVVPASLTPVTAQPKTIVQRNHTNFYPALQCMDDLFLQTDRQKVLISAGPILDHTNSIRVDARSMIVTALNNMTRKSQAFGFVEQGLSVRRTGETFNLELNNNDDPRPPRPALYIDGSISQVDANTRSTEVKLEASDSRETRDLRSLDTNGSLSNSIVTLDLRLLTYPRRVVVPGSAISNSMVVRERGWGQGFGGEISQRTLGITLVINAIESEGQAVRSLIELGLIEMLGRFTGVPFWECLALPSADAHATAREERRLASISDIEKMAFAQQILSDLGYQVTSTGQMNAHTRSALAHFQSAQGLLTNGTLDFDTYRALRHQNARLRPSTLPSQSRDDGQANLSTPHRSPPAPVPSRPRVVDDGFQSLQTYLNPTR